ncbi:hypothetical protein BH11BAC4_BH11BAC4_22680 [soil metagenome]
MQLIGKYAPKKNVNFSDKHFNIIKLKSLGNSPLVKYNIPFK